MPPNTPARPGLTPSAPPALRGSGVRAGSSSGARRRGTPPARAASSPAISCRWARYRIETMVLGQPRVVGERVERGETRFGTVHHRDRDGLVECDHRVGCDPLEHLVQHHDLGPVGVFGVRRFVVHRGDRGLDLVRTDRARARASTLMSSTPSSIADRSQRVRSCSARGTNAAVGTTSARLGARRSAASARADRRPRRRPAAGRAPRASGGSLRS